MARPKKDDTKDTEQDTEQNDEQDALTPRTYPPETLFVGVCDGDQSYAGYDGGPGKGGRGRWRVGQVGTWTANYSPPMARRNPDDGLVWRGWLEVVTQSARNTDGSLTCLSSEKIWEKRSATAPQRSDKSLPGGAPSAAARKRASGTGTPLEEMLGPKRARRNLTGDIEPTPAGRAVDQMVG